MPQLTATATPPIVLERLRRLTPPVAAFAAGAGPVILLGFSRGGYPVEVVAGYGVALWWLLLVGLLTDAIPRPRPTRAGWVVLAALVLLTAWGALSLGRSVDAERGLTEVARLVVAGGTVLLGMSAVRSGQSRVLAGGVLAGLTAIVGAAVLSRLFPMLVPTATETGEFLASTRTRLAWPLNYWNGIAAAAAIAVPLGLALAARSRSAFTSAAAIAPLPVLALGLAFTLSRGGMAATAVAISATVVLLSPRPLVLRTAVVAAVGISATLVAGLRSQALTDVVGGAAQADAGRRVFVVLFAATAGVALLQGGLRLADRAHWTPQLPRPARRPTIALVIAGAAVLIVVAIALGVPDRASNGWDRFRDRQVTSSISTDNSSERLSSVSGNGRYQMWSGALDAMSDHPIAGIGLGSWESWWNPRRGDTGFVRNAHSEPFELLAETGIVGGALFLAVLLLPLAAGVVGPARRARLRRDESLLVVPAFVAFILALAVDWNWQLGALMVAGMTLAAVPLSVAGDASMPERQMRTQRKRLASAVGVAAVSIGSIVVLALALVAPQSVDASRSAAARGDLSSAVREAAAGENAAGFAATPALQRALVEEQAGNLAGAEAAARRAAQRTPDDWRPWFLIARIATARGADGRAIAAFRRAKSLNPESPILGP